MLEEGATFVLDGDPAPGDVTRCHLPHPEILQALEPGHAILLDDGKLRLSVTETTGLGRSDASKAVEAVFDAIGSALKRGDEVRLVGFGTFSCSKRKASTGRNPRTGEPMQIKESTQPKFKAGKGLKDLVSA